MELTAFARDFFPERERVYSSPVRIYVLGNEKHAEWVRQKLDSVFARPEEVSRLEEKIAANTEALQAMTNSPQAAEKLENANASGVSEVRKEVGSEQETKVEKTFSWSPVAFRIPPDSTVELTAFARDFFPERERVYS